MNILMPRLFADHVLQLVYNSKHNSWQAYITYSYTNQSNRNYKCITHMLKS